MAISLLSSLPQASQSNSTNQSNSEKSISELFAWTLTRFTPAFSQITPIFRTRKNLLDYIESKAQVESRTCEQSSEIIRIAVDKINSEWRAWVNAHAEFSFEEHRLDDMLMKVLYRFILQRDQKKCALCEATPDLTIHHIIGKRRNLIATPPFGRSVPTNLITLCRICHSYFDPSILTSGCENRLMRNYSYRE
ncbi:MAG: HNH endonuclease [Thaumarchaeota archaeon]|nr:HNH endonuclease [Nitrososphaerota archaeon]